MRNSSNTRVINILIGIGLILNIICISILGFVAYEQTSDDGDGWWIKTLTWGMASAPPYLDPTDSWDSQANVVIRQCSESLWWYNYSDPNLPLIRVLAEDEEWISTTQLRVTCRAGVFFHDDTPFNADAAIWNLERLEYLCNHTGELDPDTQRAAKTSSLYEFPDGSPIIDHFTKISEFVFDIFLTAPFSDLLDIYAYVCGNMLSPTAHAAQEHRFITLQEKLIGTGPFIYDEYVPNTEIRFNRNEYYRNWGYFDKLVFKIISDPPTRNYAMLAGDIDWIQGPDTDLYEVYKSDPLITFHENEIPGFAFSYIGMNHDTINVTWRKAISYAVNYSYVISDYHGDSVLRAYGPISPAFGVYYKPGFDAIAPYMNISVARQTILDGLGADARLSGLNATDYRDDPVNDANWNSTKLIKFNYTGNRDNQFRADMLPMLQLWLGRIGINVTDGLTTYGYWLQLLMWPPPKIHLELYWVGWGPTFLSPMNQIEPLMSNTSTSNSAKINDPQLEAWFVQWFLTTDIGERIELCHNISEYIATVLYPHVYVYHPKIISIHAADLYNCPYNALGHFWAHPIKQNQSWWPW